MTTRRDFFKLAGAIAVAGSARQIPLAGSPPVQQPNGSWHGMSVVNGSHFIEFDFLQEDANYSVYLTQTSARESPIWVAAKKPSGFMICATGEPTSVSWMVAR